MDLMVISPATEKTSRTYSLNSFTLNALLSNLNLYDSAEDVLAGFIHKAGYQCPRPL